MIKKWESEHRQILALVMFVVGIGLSGVGGGYLVYRRTILSFATAPHHINYKTRTAAPQSIRFANQELPIEPATIQNGIWQTSETRANHLDTSANPGESDNIVIYGHNKPSIFRSLHQLKLADYVEVTSADGLLHQYQIIEISKVDPSQVEVVYPSDSELLTLYTCTGWLDNQRLVVKAVPTNLISNN